MIIGSYNALSIHTINSFLSSKTALWRFSLILLLIFCLLWHSPARAFTYMDGAGEGEPCPAPIPCSKTINHIADQDNAYHNTLQAMHGPKDKTPNIDFDHPITQETDTTPGTYNTTYPPQYKPTPGGYQYGGSGIDYPPPATR